jgi:hypothetical protein
LDLLDENELFMELIRDVANELDIDVLCHKILVNVGLLTHADRGSLFLARGPRDARYLVAKLFDVTVDTGENPTPICILIWWQLTVRPPLVGEVSAERGCRVVSAVQPLRLYSRLSRPEPLLFLPSSSAALTSLSGPRSRPTTSQKAWWSRKSNPDLWICSQEL